jgi:hypothetical protein
VTPLWPRHARPRASAVGFLDELLDPGTEPGPGGEAGDGGIDHVVGQAVACAEALAAHGGAAYVQTRDLVWGAVRDEVASAPARRRDRTASGAD